MKYSYLLLVALSLAAIPRHARANCEEDVVVDGVVDVEDLVAVITHWGPCIDTCAGDVNSDGTVNGEDLVAVLSAWGECTERGNAHFLFVVAAFEDSSEMPATDDEVWEAVDLMHRDWEFYSAGNLMVTGELASGYTISFSGENAASCNYNSWSSAALDAAAQDGFVLDDYDYYMVFLPQPAPGCPSGVALISRSTAVISVGTQITATRHEAGHLFGFHHAAYLHCGDMAMTEGPTVVNSGDCTALTYGDKFDVMGTGSHGLNGPHLLQGGFLDAPLPEPITEPGTYILEAIDGWGAGTVLEVPRAGDNYNYYLSYRAPEYYAPPHPYPSQMANDGVFVHVWKPAYGGPYWAQSDTYLINTHPNGEINYFDHPYSLLDGHLFSDAYYDISVRQISHDDNAAVVEISFEPVAPCVQGELTASSTSITTGPDEQVFSVSLTNGDTGACSGKSLLLVSPSPGGWNGEGSVALSSDRIYLEPGTTSEITLTVVLPDELPPDESTVHIVGLSEYTSDFIIESVELTLP